MATNQALAKIRAKRVLRALKAGVEEALENIDKDALADAFTDLEGIEDDVLIAKKHLHEAMTE